MANDKQLENPKPRLITLEKEEYEKFINNLPRNKSFDKAIREYIKSCNEESEKIKNVNSPNYSAVAITNNNIQTKLDKYFPNHLRDWQSFKNVIENELNDDERIQMTELTYENLRMLEMVNKNKSGRKHYPLLKV